MILDYQDFLYRVRESPRTWVLNDLGSPAEKLCRSELSGDCPWLVVFDAVGQPSTLKVLRGQEEMSSQIFRAADGHSGMCPIVRQDLLQACGLA